MLRGRFPARSWWGTGECPAAAIGATQQGDLPAREIEVHTAEDLLSPEGNGKSFRLQLDARRQRHLAHLCRRGAGCSFQNCARLCHHWYLYVPAKPCGRRCIIMTNSKP